MFDHLRSAENYPIYDQRLHELITTAVAHIQDEIQRAIPLVAPHILAWMHHLAGSSRPEDYFVHPVAFPMHLLPWWAEQTLRAEPTGDFQFDLIYSTINGYYYIRLIDNVMDGDATVEQRLLPTLGFFHTRFQGAYQRHFPHAHPFWSFFDTVWCHSAEVTMRDGMQERIDLAWFVDVAAKKVAAAQIPVAAVCYRYDRDDLIAPWSKLIDLLGCWHQMWNDLFGWRKDAQHHVQTYFLSEAERRSRPGESLTAWLIREGIGWGMKMLDSWMADLRSSAAQLHSPGLDAYLVRREQMVREQYEAVYDGLRSAAKLLAFDSSATHG